MLDIRLLGGFRMLSPQGAPIEIAQRKARALCACLAVATDGVKSRDALATLLWADRDPARARQCLRGWLVLERCGDATRAAEAYSRSLEIARKQRSLAIELRVLCSLVAMSAQSQDGGLKDRKRWRSGLESAAARFTEGEGCADLQAARKLLGANLTPR